jgi:hypothetical protein
MRFVILVSGVLSLATVNAQLAALGEISNLLGLLEGASCASGCGNNCDSSDLSCICQEEYQGCLESCSNTILTALGEVSGKFCSSPFLL